MIYYNSFEELVEEECKWHGARWRGRIYKQNLVDYCTELGIETNYKDDKTTLYNKLIKKTTHYKIYLKFRDEALGVPAYWYEERFGINKSQRNKMISEGFIKVRYSVNTKIFSGTYADVHYADAHQFFKKMDQEKIDRWREKNIRGFKKK